MGNCGTYKAQGYCSYSPNVQAQCRETCNIDGCGSSAPAPARPAPTPSAAPSVPAPARPAPTPVVAPSVPAPSGCFDIDGACDHYRRQGYCSTDHIKKHCAKTCGAC